MVDKLIALQMKKVSNPLEVKKWNEPQRKQIGGYPRRLIAELFIVQIVIFRITCRRSPSFLTMWNFSLDRP